MDSKRGREATPLGSESISGFVKKIEAYVKPFKLNDVKHRLGEAGVDIIRVLEVQESGHQKQELVHGAEFAVDFSPKTLVILTVRDDQEDAAVLAIREAARTGHAGDGEICVTHIEKMIPVDPSDNKEKEKH